jgi:hypothetical protein
MAYLNPRYNGRVGVYRTNEIERFSTPTLGWTGSVFHVDASLDTTTSYAYGYNLISGSDIIRMSNLSDVSGVTDLYGSVKLQTISGKNRVYLVVPNTPLYTNNYGMSSSLSHGSTSTYSTYFAVWDRPSQATGAQTALSYMTDPNITTDNWIYHYDDGNIIQSNTQSSPIYQYNPPSLTTFGVKYLIKLRGSNTQTSNSTLVNINGVTSSLYTGAPSAQSPDTFTRVLDYYITDTPPNKTLGATLSFNEIIYFNYDIGESQATIVENYLKSKWGLTY